MCACVCVVGGELILSNDETEGMQWPDGKASTRIFIREPLKGF